mgnify:CR=1 FL=1
MRSVEGLVRSSFRSKRLTVPAERESRPSRQATDSLRVRTTRWILSGVSCKRRDLSVPGLGFGARKDDVHVEQQRTRGEGVGVALWARMRLVDDWPSTLWECRLGLGRDLPRTPAARRE